MDQGVYAIQAAQWAFGEAPIGVEATGVIREGVDMEMYCTLRYANGGVAKISADSTKILNNQYIIKGTKGTITVSVKRFFLMVILINSIIQD